MAYVDVCILVPNAKKSAVEEAVNWLTPTYGVMGFSVAVCPVIPAPTWESTPTHWRAADSMLQPIAVAWQYVALEGELPEDFVLDENATMTEQEIIDAFDGTRVWIGNDVGDSVIWAASNMNSLSPVLVDRPQPPFI